MTAAPANWAAALERVRDARRAVDDAEARPRIEEFDDALAAAQRQLIATPAATPEQVIIKFLAAFMQDGWEPEAGPLRGVDYAALCSEATRFVQKAMEPRTKLQISIDRFLAEAARGQADRWSKWRKLRTAFQIARDTEDDFPVHDPDGDALNEAKCARMDDLIQAEAPNEEALRLKMDLLTKRYRDFCGFPEEDLDAVMRDAYRFARLCDDFLYPERPGS